MKSRICSLIALQKTKGQSVWLGCLLVSCLMLGFMPISSIILRHDKGEALFRKFGEKYADIVVDLKVPTSRYPMGRSGNGVGVLISPNWVLTAGHVAAGLKEGHPASRLKGPHAVTVAGKEYEIESVILHPDWVEPGPHDIALVRLKKGVANNRFVTPYSDDDEVGKNIIVIGWGDTGTGLEGPTAGDQKLRGATNRVEEVTDDNIVFSFDGPESKNTTELEGISGPGDSGGPALAEIGGKLHVLGVSVAQDGHGRGRGRYGATEFYTRVSTHLKWINKTVQAK